MDSLLYIYYYIQISCAFKRNNNNIVRTLGTVPLVPDGHPHLEARAQRAEYLLLKKKITYSVYF